MGEEVNVRWLVSGLVATLAACANPVNQKTATIYYDSAVEAEIRGDFAFAERQYSRALVNAQIGHSPDEGISAAMYGLGRAKAYLCKFAEAEQLLIESLQLQEKAGGRTGPIITKRLLELARFYADRGHFQQSLTYFEQGITILEKLDVESTDPIAFSDLLDDYAGALTKSGHLETAHSIRSRSENLRAKHPNKKAIFVPLRYGVGCSK